tara:strand:- start:572 stop:892 length:321 start_codon:yes stop_codon:yes gene_type:complete
MSTTWTIEGGGLTGWTPGTTSSASQNFNLTDDQLLTFGSGNDYSITYDSTQDRLEFNNNLGTRIASLSTTALYLDQVNFIELNSLPAATEGGMVYFNNEYYLCVGS